jgi:Ca2+-binding RTX toxin-like protein
MSTPVDGTIPDLTQSQRNDALDAPLWQEAPANSVGWDVNVVISRSDDDASVHHLYRVNLTADGVYDLQTSSSDDPAGFAIYDGNGKALDVRDGSSDQLRFTAPYTGVYYVDAGWQQYSWYKPVTLSIWGDIPLPGTDGNNYWHAVNAYGGLGNDSIVGFNTSTYLRGDEGDDVISGGSAFDDINGNMGDDTAHGNLGDDWVVGGKDQDALYGDAGDDIVYGNLGNDTCDGGAGADLIRGGQGDDSLTGGDGNDWISGDRGNDTMTGGLGADTFHTFSGAGVDRVLDFHASEGDKVQVDVGTTYAVKQVGADTVIDMGNGDQMVLVGVQMSTLPTGWIFTL